MKRLLVVAAALAVSTDAGAKCALAELAPKLLTPDGAKLPADGGVLVGYESRMPVDNNPPRALPATFQATDGSSTVELATRQIAPGVFVYTPKTAGKTTLTLKDGTTVVGTFPRGATDKADLPAPDATKGFVHVDGTRRSQILTFTVEVASVPDAAFGVVAYDASGKAMSFATVPHDKAGKTTIRPYVSGGRCVFGPPGSESPGINQKVTVAWVDRFGRISKPSQVITVEGSTPSIKNGVDDE